MYWDSHLYRCERSPSVLRYRPHIMAAASEPATSTIMATVRQRITFKTAVLVYKCRHGMAPPYLSAYCEPTSSHGGRCHLHSAESGQLTVTRMRTNYGDRSFDVHGPVVWNSLPADLRLLNISLPVFRKRLKMFLF